MPDQQSPGRDEWPRLRAVVPSWDDLRSSLWFWPAVSALVGFLLATLLNHVEPDEDSPLGQLAWPGDRESASAFLQVVAGSVITVTSLTFSLVVLALQLASQQFSPRLLREFARDIVTQLVLGTLVTTFVFAVTVLRGLNEDEPLPTIGLAVTFVLVLASISALLGFLGHIARLVRVDTMMAAVHRETRQTIEQCYPPYEAEDDLPAPRPAAGRGQHVVTTARSGFVQVVYFDALARAAHERDAVVVLGVRPGDHVTTGTPIARVIGDAAAGEALEGSIRAAIELGYERTTQQDVALGLRQLTDIAVKALSPGINDPTTAGHAVGHVSDLLVRLLGRRLGAVAHTGPDGVPRVHAADHDIRFYLDLVVAPIRRYAANEPLVLLALLRMLRDAAVSARDDEQRSEVRRQAHLVVETAGDLHPADLEVVHDGARRVEQALRGDVLDAFEDRAGETRSL